MPKVSIIIPCFNQGQYLDEAIQSVLEQTFQDFEIIVVNDGSTDPETIEKFKAIDYPRTRVIETRNLGAAGARNLGIRHARGEFILPLDADDKIASTYLETAHSAMSGDARVGLAYCKAAFFGEMNGPWSCPDYQFPDVLISPCIHSCSLFRKLDWEAVGGYCDEMVHGWEDYDLWISLLEMGRRVHYIPEILFYYRQHGKNRTKGISESRHRDLFGMIFSRHQKIYEENMADLLLLSYSHVVSGIALKERVLRSEQNLHSLRRSVSWRVTAPFRRFESLFSRANWLASKVKTEAGLFMRRILVLLPLSRRLKDVRAELEKPGESGI